MMTTSMTREEISLQQIVDAPWSVGRELLGKMIARALQTRHADRIRAAAARMGYENVSGITCYEVDNERAVWVFDAPCDCLLDPDCEMCDGVGHMELWLATDMTVESLWPNDEYPWHDSPLMSWSDDDGWVVE